MREFQKELWNLPNILSIIRIVVSPVLILLLITPDRVMGVIAAIFFLSVCFTDWLDGYIARKRGTVTAVGKFLDPLADKVLIVTALIMLINLGRTPAWMVALIVSREVAVTGLRTVAARSSISIPAGWMGKTKTVTQICAITFLLLHYPFFGIDFHSVGMMALWVALLATVWSGVDYFIRFFSAPAAGRV
ncbi:MAG: CDP-diacylglycerol--glycerol-3-phosphate 3-phosphatidyltransferase [Deltaproteobacteria bacterium]|nr:CDP-diacylglycerol--glycerol-3-phosphate 3-phosphatidyltransferase [Deltaproteobacteria bacterium]